MNISELAMHLSIHTQSSQSSFTFEKAAIEAFKYFHEQSKQHVIDQDILAAILHDAGVKP